VSPTDLAARLRVTFAAELEDQLRAADAHLLVLDTAPDNAEELRGLFRVMHTLKGAAHAAGAADVETLCHAAESTLASVRDAGRAVTRAELEGLFRAVDALRATNPAREKAPVLPSTTVAAPEPRDDASVRVSAERLDALLSASNRLLIASGRAADESGSFDGLRDEVQALTAAWRHQHREIRRRLGETTDMVTLSRDLDRFSERLRHLAAATASTATSAADTSRGLSLVTDDLSRGVRQLRVRPFHDAVEGLPRTIRDIAAASGKQARLEIQGTDVDADRGVLDLLREAILHLVRNAVDHGIETPAERRAAGKDEVGTVTVAATVLGDRIRVSVSDDGRGIDIAGIRREFARRGRPITGDDQAVIAHLLAGEGISTRAVGGTISGRGVGLDAANVTVRRARGHLSVHWVQGAGTTFTIDTPLTLATIRAILVKAGDLIIACPTSHVDRMVRVPIADLQVSEGRAAIATHAGPAALTSLGSMLGATASTASGEAIVALLVVDPAGRRVALRVDELIAEREVVVRPIPAQGGSPARHISGAALLPTGAIALVLNVPAVIEDAIGHAELAAPVAPQIAKRAARKRVLVVDDSITTRTLEQSVLEAAGYDVVTAVDGADGWRVLQERGADVVVADVEMPRMDGLELCHAVRASHRFKDLPFVLITALESPEHRAKGMEAGADAYLGKSSFEQAALVDVLRDLLGA
jgi:two-component system chemotaxis sensor kinase CheA